MGNGWETSTLRVGEVGKQDEEHDSSRPLIYNIQEKEPPYIKLYLEFVSLIILYVEGFLILSDNRSRNRQPAIFT